MSERSATKGRLPWRVLGTGQAAAEGFRSESGSKSLANWERNAPASWAAISAKHWEPACFQGTGFLQLDPHFLLPMPSSSGILQGKGFPRVISAQCDQI